MQGCAGPGDSNKISMGSQLEDRSPSHILANPEFSSFKEFHFVFCLAHSLLYRGDPPAPRPDLTENFPDHKACKVIKIQQIKL